MMHQALRALEQDELPVSILDAPILAALRGVLSNPDLDPAFKTLMLSLPDRQVGRSAQKRVDPQRIKRLQAMHQQMAHALRGEWERFMEHTQIHWRLPSRSAKCRQARPGQSGAEQSYCRVARDTGDTVWPGKAYQRTKDASNMTDRIGAVQALHGRPEPAGHAGAAAFPQPVQGRTAGGRQMVQPASPAQRHF